MLRSNLELFEASTLTHMAFALGDTLNLCKRTKPTLWLREIDGKELEYS